MALPKHYNPQETELRLQAFWQEAGVYHFSEEAEGPVYSVDSPPATVSGYLHLGHVYSYTHPDLIARFWRMRGWNVFYPMGYDDNGLPTERLVEKRLGVTAAQVGRSAFIEKCLQVSEESEKEYQALWKRLGLSVDWRYTYRTIDERSRRISQTSFIDLYRKGLVYQREAPAIWCPECRTSIAQAEVNDLERNSEFVTLKFSLTPKRSFAASPSPAGRGEPDFTASPPLPAGEGGQGGEGEAYLPIATTRPELLPACVAVFVHPQDARYRGLVDRSVRVPLFGQQVPVLEDPGADPEKGTGAVMCCTFGDTADVAWWYTHKLPLVQAIDRQGRMANPAGAFAGLPLEEARRQVKLALDQEGLLLDRQPASQTVRVHERCDTPVEYIVARQWFVRVLDFREQLLKAGEQIRWHPEPMRSRYRAWVENLNWDWCISRQRTYGVPFPLWYCKACGEVILADEDQLPVDPLEQAPQKSCACGSSEFIPEQDVFDTWATSSLSPQIVGGWLPDQAGSTAGRDAAPGRLYERVFPYSLRPQAHEIIRTWAFYTITKSLYHFGELPWKEVLISGWGIAGEGMGKISKSRGGGPLPPLEMIQRYSADAVRYWASSTSPGKDSVISEEKIQTGAKLVTKLWNVARFSERFIEYYSPAPQPPLSPADRWILSRLQKLIRRVTGLMEGYDYATAKSEVESFFWTEMADNYLEMCKQRLYDEDDPQREGARFTLDHLLLAVIKLFAPFLPYVTEEIYQSIFLEEKGRGEKGTGSIHRSSWPAADPSLEDDASEAVGQVLVDIATAVRRYKSERNLSLGTELSRLQLATADPALAEALKTAITDLRSITRSQKIEIVGSLDPDLVEIQAGGNPRVAVERA